MQRNKKQEQRLEGTGVPAPSPTGKEAEEGERVDQKVGGGGL